MMQQLINRVGVIKSVQKMFVTPCIENPDKGSSESASSDGDFNETICVCQVVAPVIRFCQLFGIFPVTFFEPVSSRSNGKDGQLCERHYNSTFQHLQPFKHGVVGGIPVLETLSYKSCQLKSRLLSLPSFNNIFLMILFVGVSCWTFSQFHKILTVYFEGTDLYAFGAQTICLYVQCNFILINSFIQRHKFPEIWILLLNIMKKLTVKPTGAREHEKTPDANEPETKPVFIFPSTTPTNTNSVTSHVTLQNIVATSAFYFHLKQSGDTHRKIKAANDTPLLRGKPCKNLSRHFKLLQLFSYICVLTIIVMSVSHISAFFILVFRACFDKTVDPGNNDVVLGKPPCPLNNFMLFLQKCFYGMIDFIKQGSAMLFGTFCLIIYLLFQEVEEQLEELLRNFGEITKPGMPIQLHCQLEHLRLCYEDLCRLCRLMSQCFGLSNIAIMITSVVSITCALYSFALYSGAIDRNESMEMSRFYVIWVFHGYFGCFCLILVLIPGQLITNASETPSQVIAKYPMAHLDKETKYQLSQFQQQARQPVIINACKMANVGLGFISAAATNVTTYILVILQFRLGVEK